MSPTPELPSDFLWGAATAAYQIEGATRADGRGESIWDRFARVPGNVEGGHTGDVACDHYRRAEADVALMADLGLRAYRFSIAWPRIVPGGRGQRNRAGIDFYSRLVDHLLARGIAPCATLYHWDLPQGLEDEGGWLVRDTAKRFADYADVMFRALGDRVARWVTHSEPWCAAFLGHFRGVHAPGKTSLRAGLLAAHHLLLSHGLAVGACRATFGDAARVGMALGLVPSHPFADGEAHARATRLADGTTNRWFLDPIYRGGYPADTLEHVESLGVRFDFVADGDLATIAAPTDFLGVNYAHRRAIEARAGEDLGWRVHDRPAGVPTTDGWETAPGCLTELLVRLTEDYGAPPLLVTANGAAMDDEVGPDGEVDDPRRVDFLQRHVAAALTAVGRGARLEGFLAGSLIDGFEWTRGYAGRSGIVHVDHDSQRRVPKSSARYLQRVIRDGFERARGEPLDRRRSGRS